jgi:hypothetical protein
MKEKGFFYIPTGALILLCVVSILSLGFEGFFFLNIDSFETITVNGIQYNKGTEQYHSGMETMKNALMVSVGITCVFSMITGFFSIKRIKSK